MASSPVILSKAGTFTGGTSGWIFLISSRNELAYLPMAVRSPSTLRYPKTTPPKSTCPVTEAKRAASSAGSDGAWSGRAGAAPIVPDRGKITAKSNKVIFIIVLNILVVDFSNDSVSISALRDRLLQAWLSVISELQKLFVNMPLVIMNCLHLIHHIHRLDNWHGGGNSHKQWTGET